MIELESIDSFTVARGQVFLFADCGIDPRRLLYTKVMINGAEYYVKEVEGMRTMTDISYTQFAAIVEPV